MATWTLAEIRQKVRQVSGRLSVAELSNTQVDEYINKYFQYEFPAEVKLNRNYTFYEFNTNKDTRDYAFPTNYTNFVPEATMNRQHLLFYQDPDKFYQENPENYQRRSEWTGDGATVAFATTLTNNIPIEPGSVIVDDQVEVFSDDGAGVLTGDAAVPGTGTVNYTTGAISVTFAAAPASGQTIFLSFIQQTVGQPTAVLMFENQFRFYPVPDRAYQFRIKAWMLDYVMPVTGANKVEFTIATDRPLQDEWGPAIAFGAARRIVSDFGEMDRYAELTVLYKEQINYILTRTHIDLESSRALPMF